MLYSRYILQLIFSFKKITKPTLLIFIGFSGILPPKFHGVRYMDGAFSDNLPLLDENTVTVSPFSGETDICPRDDSAQMFHVRFFNIFFLK